MHILFSAVHFILQMASCKSEEICSCWFIAQNNKSLVYIVNSCPRTCHQKSIKWIINSFGGGERNIPDPPDWLYLMQKALCCITIFYWSWDLVVSVDFVALVHHCINLIRSPSSVPRQTSAICTVFERLLTLSIFFFWYLSAHRMQTPHAA